MDNQKKPDIPQDDSWLDEFLAAPEVNHDIGPDEHAISFAGLTHPADAELERIIQETKSEAWPEEISKTESPQEPFRDQEYRDAFGEGDDLDAVFSEEVPSAPAKPTPRRKERKPEPEPDPEEQPLPKRRPHMKKGYGLFGIPHVLATFIWVAIAISIGVSLGRMLWVCAADVLAFGRTEQKITVTIDSTDDLESISNKLKDAGLIRYPGLFKMYVELTSDEDENISPGVFTLNTIYDYHALKNAMTYSSDLREVVEDVMIPEGYTCAQIFALLEEKGVCTVAELEDWAANGELSDYWFLEGVERGDKYCLEGYLFPDTYDFYTNDDPQRVLEKFLDAFDYRFTEKMHESLTTINERFTEMLADNGYDADYIAENQITIREVVIIASMIEKETAGSHESYMIASVIYNRLANQASFPFLNIDATVIYALGGKDGPLTVEDLQFDSPYNTYVEKGMIPGPISNPGRDSLYAALDPYDGDETYYYYALDPDTWDHRFFEDEDDFNEFVDSVDYDE